MWSLLIGHSHPALQACLLLSPWHSWLPLSYKAQQTFPKADMHPSPVRGQRLPHSRPTGVGPSPRQRCLPPLATAHLLFSSYWPAHFLSFFIGPRNYISTNP